MSMAYNSIIPEHTEDPKKLLLDRVGNVNDIELFNNQILVAIYVRPEKTRGGIIITDRTRKEDWYQCKIGLIIKMGPSAFVPDGQWFEGTTFNVGDWVVYRPSDGWALTIFNKDYPVKGAGDDGNVLCRILDDVSVRGRVPHPDRVW